MGSNTLFSNLLSPVAAVFVSGQALRKIRGIKVLSNKHGGAVTHKVFTEVEADLAPGRSKIVPLGSYAKSESLPTFTLTVSTGDAKELNASLERQDITNTPRYVMFYQLYNSSDKPCRVMVRRTSKVTP